MRKLIGCTISVFLVSQMILLADPLAEARKAEQRGDVEGAFMGYTQWVESQKDLDRQVDTLLRVIDGIPDLERAIRFLNSSVGKLKNPVNRSRILSLQASLWERMGAFESAEQAYRGAYETYPVPSSLSYLVRSACLLYELGELEKSEKQLRFVLNQTEKPEDRWEAQFHLARIFAITNRLSDALTVGKRLLEETVSYGKDPQTLLYFLYTVTGALGMKKEQESYRIALEKNGGLLRHFIAPDEKSKITPLPLPSLFFSGLTVAATPNTVTSKLVEGQRGQPSASNPTHASPTKPTGIQVGSFSNRENAEYLVKDLRRLGFPASVKQSQWKDGSFLYRTVVLLRTDPSENPQTVLIKLKEYGFEGFFLFEPNGE